MNRPSPRKRAFTLGSALTALLMCAFVVPSSASADTLRTLNIALNCSTGLPYGMSVNTGSGWYYPDGSSYAVNTTKYFSVYISSSASELEIDTGYCDNESTIDYGDMWLGSYVAITPGTSTINANGYCQFMAVYPGYHYRTCTVSNITYS